MKRERRAYTKEFKQEAVNLVRSGGRTKAEIARSLDIHENVLSKWVRASKDEGDEAFRGNGVRTSVEDENRKLRRRVQNLEMELEFLKKVSRYFAKDPK